MSDREEYVTRQELARIMSLGVRTVDRFRAEGMPCHQWGLRAVRFLPSEALAWATKRGTHAGE